MFLKKEKAFVAHGIDYDCGFHNIDVVGECVIEGEKQEIAIVTTKQTGEQKIALFMRKRSKSTHTKLVNAAVYAYRFKLHKPLLWLLNKVGETKLALELEDNLLELSASLYAFKHRPYHRLVLVEEYKTTNNYLGIIKDELEHIERYTDVLWYV